jgi:hypothetical protein
MKPQLQQELLPHDERWVKKVAQEIFTYAFFYLEKDFELSSFECGKIAAAASKAAERELTKIIMGETK